MPIKESSDISKQPKKLTAKSNTILILMRHATRAFEGDQLSPEGRLQATALLKTLEKMKMPAPTALKSSPKRRTQATLRPLSQELKLAVAIDPRLDERMSGESTEKFESRVEAFLAECDQSLEKIILACSHLDWLETAVLLLTSDEGDLERAEPWSPMAIRAYILDDGIWKRVKTSC